VSREVEPAGTDRDGAVTAHSVSFRDLTRPTSMYVMAFVTTVKGTLDRGVAPLRDRPSPESRAQHALERITNAIAHCRSPLPRRILILGQGL
jgi:hypothetical protein